MILKILSFALLAVAVLAKKSKEEAMYGECRSDSDKMDTIKDETADLEATLIEATQNGVNDLIRALQSKNPDNSLITNMCSSAADVVSDVLDIVDVMASCYDPAHQSKIDELANSVEGVLVGTFDYLCDDDGAKIIEFIEEGGLECLESKGNAIDECLSVDADTTEFEQETTDKIQKCVSGVLKKCSSPVLAEDFDAWYQEIRDEIPATAGEEPKGNKSNKKSGNKKSSGDEKKKKKSKSSGGRNVASISVNVLPILYFVVSHFH